LLLAGKLDLDLVVALVCVEPAVHHSDVNLDDPMQLALQSRCTNAAGPCLHIHEAPPA
jgi:hypothetical protein